MDREKIVKMAKQDPEIGKGIEYLIMAEGEKHAAKKKGAAGQLHVLDRDAERAVKYFENAIAQFEKAGLEEEIKEIYVEIAELYLMRDWIVPAAHRLRKAGCDERAKDVLIRKADRLMAKKLYFQASLLYQEAELKDKVDEAWEKIKDAYLKRHEKISGYGVISYL